MEDVQLHHHTWKSSAVIGQSWGKRPITSISDARKEFINVFINSVPSHISHQEIKTKRVRKTTPYRRSKEEFKKGERARPLPTAWRVTNALLLLKFCLFVSTARHQAVTRGRISGEEGRGDARQGRGSTSLTKYSQSLSCLRGGRGRCDAVSRALRVMCFL